MIKPIITNNIPPQKGIVTYHHDQLIIWHNLSTINATPSRDKVDIPLEELDFSDIIIIILKVKVYQSYHPKMQ